MPNPNLGGVYANMDFEKLYGPKTFKEYPKHISTGRNGQFKVANNAAEEAKIVESIEKIFDDLPPETPVPVNIDHDREALLKEAGELGVPINRKWSKEKLQQAIDDFLLPEDPKDGVSDEKLKEQLLARAKELNIPNVSKLWGIPRLQSTIKSYEAGK